MNAHGLFLLQTFFFTYLIYFQKFGGNRILFIFKTTLTRIYRYFYVKLCILFSRFNKIIVFLQNQLNNKRL